MFDIEYFLKMYILKEPFTVTIRSIFVRHAHRNSCMHQYNCILFQKVNAFVLISNGIKDVGSLIWYKGLLLARFAWYFLDQPILIAAAISKTVCPSKKCIRLY